MDWRDAMARFEVERQTATLMEHLFILAGEKSDSKILRG